MLKLYFVIQGKINIFPRYLIVPDNFAKRVNEIKIVLKFYKIKDKMTSKVIQPQLQPD